MNRLQVIFFDGWNTVIRNTRKPPPLSNFNTILGRSFNDYNYLYLFENHFALDATGDVSRVLDDFLKTIGQCVTNDQRDGLLAALEETATDIAWCDDALECLTKLKQKYRLGLISNTGIHGAEALRAGLKIDSVFEMCTFSYELGALKPDPAIFRTASLRMSVPPESAVFVGDHPVSDYRGAMDVGMRAILIDRKGRHADKGMRIIRSLSELPAAIDRLPES